MEERVSLTEAADRRSSRFVARVMRFFTSVEFLLRDAAGVRFSLLALSFNVADRSRGEEQTWPGRVVTPKGHSLEETAICVEEN